MYYARGVQLAIVGISDWLCSLYFLSDHSFAANLGLRSKILEGPLRWANRQ